MLWLRRAALVAPLLLSATAAWAAEVTNIDMFFPVPVQGKLAVEMRKLIDQFNAAHPAIHATAVYTGSYDDTDLKTRAAIKAGRPPAAAIMSANFIRQYVIGQNAISLDGLIAKDGRTPAQFMAGFWPALRINAMENGHVYGVPFQNSTPLLFYNVKLFQEAGLDPNKPPRTWAEWVADARKLAKPGGAHWGLMMPESYDYLGWLTSALAMSNGGQYYNWGYGGEVYYNQPTTIGAVRFIGDLVHKWHVMPDSITDANAVTSAFFSGRTGMMLLSTGALGFVREAMKQPFRVAFLPRAMVNAAPIGGGSLLIPRGNSPERQAAAWTLIKWLTSPAIAGHWSRFTGYFAPVRAAYDLPEMKAYMAKHPNAAVALRQLRYARPWFATYDTVPVRKALEDQVQAVITGKVQAAAAMVAAQKAAHALLLPYVQQTALRQVP